MSIEDHIGREFDVGRSRYRLVKARAMTPEEEIALKAKQDACRHDSSMLLLTDPPKCPRCLKDMR